MFRLRLVHCLVNGWVWYLPYLTYVALGTYLGIGGQLTQFPSSTRLKLGTVGDPQVRPVVRVGAYLPTRCGIPT